MEETGTVVPSPELGLPSPELGWSATPRPHSFELVSCGAGAELEFGKGPSSSDINFLPPVLREPLPSLLLIISSALALGLRAGILAPQPHCSPAGLSFPQASPSPLWALLACTPPQSFELLPRRRSKVWC